MNKHGRGPLADDTYKISRLSDKKCCLPYLALRFKIKKKQRTSRIKRKPYFCICQKAQISPVTTQVDQSICFIAALIEMIEKSPKILNPKLKD